MSKAADINKLDVNNPSENSESVTVTGWMAPVTST